MHPPLLRAFLFPGTKLTSNVLLLFRSIKYSLITKLIVQMEINLQDESITYN
jgi:hypothetical protein